VRLFSGPIRAALAFGVLACLLTAAGCGAGSDMTVSSRLGEVKEQRAFLVQQQPAADAFLPESRDAENYFMPDIMGNGATLADFDQDGDLDLFLAGNRGNRLWLNEQGDFSDATAGSGLEDCGYATGACVGDFDDDGDLDLYVTCYESDHVFRNDGAAKFADITESSGVDNPLWSTASACRDLNADGRPDLIVVNYLQYHAANRCDDGSGRADFCGPESLPGLVDKVYLNQSTAGEVRFEDATVRLGLATARGPGLGLICRDFNDDGRIDLFVANDMKANRLWLQSDDGRFVDEAELWGLAVNGVGRPEASMGIALGDWNRDGRADLLLTHIRGESNTAYVDIDGSFADRSVRTGLGASSVGRTGFGVVAADMDHDGLLDVLVANGRVKRSAATKADDVGSFWRRYAETNMLFMGQGSDSYKLLNHWGGDFTAQTDTSRALAAGDLDGDGDIDIVVTNEDAPVQLLRNEFPKRGHWLMLRLVDDKSRAILGARVELQLGEETDWRESHRCTSYLTQSDPRVHFGLGNVATCNKVSVRWPDGRWEDFQLDGEVDRLVTIRRGQGESRTTDATSTSPAAPTQTAEPTR